MAVQLNSNAEFLPVDTRTKAGTVVLPLANAIPGRAITFKDIYGSFGSNPLFLSTQAGDVFDDNTNLKAMRNPFGYVTLGCDGVSEWNIINGTLFPMYTMSTLQLPLKVSLTNISTPNFTQFLSSIGTQYSTIGFEDQVTNNTFSFYTRNRVLYYGGVPVAGTKAGAGVFITLT